MYLNEALTKLKNLKSKASRISGYINGSAVFHEDETPEFVYVDELKNYEDVLQEILDLKSKIQATNVLTYVLYKNNVIRLSHLILVNAQLRVNMGFLAKQNEHTTDAGRYGSRTKEDVKKVFAKGCDKTAFRKQLEQLELDKEELEGVLASANASTIVV